MPAIDNGSPAALIGAAALAALLAACHPSQSADAESHAVILLYHHVSEHTPRSTSVTPAVFESHLEYLDRQAYAVLPLAEIASALEAGRPLPPRAVAITFDDAYTSIETEALPRLARRNWPFTVFVSTDAVDQGLGGFLDWDALRRLEAAGASIANHSKTHDHLVRRRPGESSPAWRERVREDIEAGWARLEQELDEPARLFAWPYGEFDAELERLADDLGYISFGQQSGPAGAVSGLQRLPRFPMSTGFADLDGLGEKLRSRPLPVTVLEPDRRVLPVPARPPRLKLRVAEGPFRLGDLRCYVQGQEPAVIDRVGDEVTVTARGALRPGRGKFNCTAPATGGGGVFFWYSHLWLQPRDDGSWYQE